MDFTYLIVGAGPAGLAAAQELRRLDPAASIVLVNGEDRLPYKRTKLSKTLNAGFGRDDFALYPADWYRDQAVELITGVTVASLDPGRGSALLSDGRTLGFRKALLAVGSSSSHYPELSLREALDAERLKERWKDESTISILGGGILGVELAEQALLMGKKVFLATRSGTLMKQDLTPKASSRLRNLLESRGITLVPAVSGSFPFQAAALGSPPRIGLAKASGLEFDLGIRVDRRFRTSQASVWAAGDCSQLPDGTVCHLWHQAEAQGKAAAADMAGQGQDWEGPEFREKLEVLGDFYFSMGRRPGLPFREIEFKTAGGQDVYQGWFGAREGVTGVVMAGDKDRAKVYESAVRESWPLEKIRAVLGADGK